jgi:phosphate-selective porin OprO and OprP
VISVTKNKAQNRSRGGLVAAAAFLIFTSMQVFGQTGSASPTPSPSPSPTPRAEKKEEPPPPTTESDEDEPPPGKESQAPVNYFFPDLAPDATTFKNKLFTVRIGIAILYDYTLIGQNSTSRAQVGPQASIDDLRAGRLVFSGQFNFKRPWTYLIGGDFNEFRESGDRLFEGLDFSLTIPLWKKARITLGKQKEPFIYEMVGDAANLPQQERVLSTFFTSRNIGIRYLDNYLNDKMAFSVGVYNDWFKSNRSFKESGTPVKAKDGREYLHLGFGFRHLGADNDKLRYKGRPESNLIDNYVDTGDIPAKYARQISLEGLFNTGPFSVLTEYAHAWVNSSSKGNPEFNGFYVTGSYVLTGENLVV